MAIFLATTTQPGRQRWQRNAVAELLRNAGREISIKGSPHSSSLWGDNKSSNPPVCVLHDPIDSDSCSKKIIKSITHHALFKTERQDPVLARSRGGCRFFNGIQMGVKPCLKAITPVNIRKCPWAPATWDEAIAQYLALGVLRRMTQQEAQNPKH